MRRTRDAIDASAVAVALGEAQGDGFTERLHVAVRLAFVAVARRAGVTVGSGSPSTAADLVRSAAELGPGLTATIDAFPRAFDAGEWALAIERFLDAEVEPRLGPGVLYESLRATDDRRKGGAHYTPRAVCDALVRRTLAPLAKPAAYVCDPAMGSGAMLLATADALAAGHRAAGLEAHEARAAAAEALHGVDLDPIAVELARMGVWLAAGAPRVAPSTFASDRLVLGNALVGLSPEELTPLDAERALEATRSLAPTDAEAALDGLHATFVAARPSSRARAVRAELDAWERDGVARRLGSLRAAASRSTARLTPLHWWRVFGNILRVGGFDAFVGNPPWVSYAGRAAQPLEPALRDVLSASPAFHGYRNLQAVFVRRAAAMLAPGGRLGLVLPTSTSDLSGYAPSRRAHDELAACDAELPDFGDGGFSGVFQPCMGLLSTRRSESIVATGAPWPLSRSDLDPPRAALLARLSAMDKLPARAFGERGYQTARGETSLFARAPTGRRTIGVRTGTEIGAFRLSAPRLYCEPAELGGSFRPAEEWRRVDILVRQTARYPIAALSDGGAFRNSVLAVFAEEAWPKELLVAYLNSGALRFCHYLMHRDARQGMPQLKIGHLRSLPAPLPCPATDRLLELGHTLGARQRGLEPSEQRALDEAAADALDLSEAERAMVEDWSRTVG
jgi:hypothetical protein